MRQPESRHKLGFSRFLPTVHFTPFEEFLANSRTASLRPLPSCRYRSSAHRLAPRDKSLDSWGPGKPSHHRDRPLSRTPCSQLANHVAVAALLLELCDRGRARPDAPYRRAVEQNTPSTDRGQRPCVYRTWFGASNTSSSEEEEDPRSVREPHFKTDQAAPKRFLTGRCRHRPQGRHDTQRVTALPALSLDQQRSAHRSCCR
jgi:hypothetical protein